MLHLPSGTEVQVSRLKPPLSDSRSSGTGLARPEGPRRGSFAEGRGRKRHPLPAPALIRVGVSCPSEAVCPVSTLKSRQSHLCLELRLILITSDPPLNSFTRAQSAAAQSALACPSFGLWKPVHFAGRHPSRSGRVCQGMTSASQARIRRYFSEFPSRQVRPVIRPPMAKTLAESL